MTFFCYSPCLQSVWVPPSSSSPHVLLPLQHVSCTWEHGLFEASLIDWCIQFGDNTGTFVDVGAHTGTYSVLLAPYFERVWAFEPQRSTYYALCGSVALSQLSDKVHCVHAALGDHSTNAVLSITSEDGGGSTLSPTETCLAQETVHVQTLDSFSLEKVSFLKIDVEGHEEKVLLGARETLSRCRPKILLEDNRNMLPEFPLLKELGYTVHPLTGIPNMFFADFS